MNSEGQQNECYITHVRIHCALQTSEYNRISPPGVANQSVQKWILTGLVHTMINVLTISY